MNVEGNSHVWILRTVVGKRLVKYGKLKPQHHDIGIGPHPEISLAEARANATELRLQIRNGIDPIAHKQTELEKLKIQKLRDKTFRECALVVIANKTRELKNEKHIGQWRSTLETYIYSTLGDLSIGTISKVDIAEAITSIWIEKNQTAKHIRGRIESIFDYDKAMGCFFGDNPAEWKGNLEPILGNLKQESRPHPSLPYEQVYEYIQHLRQRKGISPKALEFAILTACRSGEIFGAKWQ